MCDEKPLGSFMYDIISYFYLKKILNINFLEAEFT